MSENNYIQETETIQSILPQSTNILEWEETKRQISFIDFVTIFDRTERAKHQNKTEIELDIGHKHDGDKKSIFKSQTQMKRAHEYLQKFILEEYNIELVGPTAVKGKFKISLNHLCKRDSCIEKKDNTQCTCCNPTHCYYGTAQENELDKDPEVRKKGGQKGGKISAAKQLVAGTHPFVNVPPAIASARGQKAGKIGGKKGGKISSAKQLAAGTHVFQNLTKEDYAKGGRAGTKSQLDSGAHNMKQKVQCPYSNHVTTAFWIARWIQNHHSHLKQWHEYTPEEQKSFYI